MVHPLSSAYINAAATAAEDSQQDSTGRRASSDTSLSEKSAANHQPGVSPPLPLNEEGHADIERTASPALPSNRPMSFIAHRDRSPHSPNRAGKQRAADEEPDTVLSAKYGSLTAAMGPQHPHKQVAGVLDLDASYGASSFLDSATSPLRVDMSKIPPASIVPHLSPEGTFSMNDAYNMGYINPPQEESDPLLLRSKVVNTERELRRRPSKGRRADKRVKDYYERQNQLIENLLKPIAKHASEDEEETEASGRMVKILIYLNIISNFVLAGLQLYAAISSLSLSLFATAADSVFDPFANLVLNWLHIKSKRLDERKWPIGGSRLENAGNIVYASIMGAVSVVLIVESARSIGSHKAGEKNDLYVPSLIAVGIAFITKAILGIMNYMYRKHSSQLDMLWVDCRNDLFINGFGLFTSAAGAKIAWWIDPSGAILISFGIIFSWSRAAFEQFRELCGAAAPVEFLQLCTYNALHIHYQHIEMIDSVKAYHSGPKYIVEVDVVMKPETPLWLSHNVSQDLQDKIEQLPMCERAFVHVDFEVDHRPEHQAAKKVK